MREKGYVAVVPTTERYASCRICGSREEMRSLIFSFHNHAHYENLCKDHLVDLKGQIDKALEE